MLRQDVARMARAFNGVLDFARPAGEITFTEAGM
jgi:hypothetical protein